MSGDARYFNNIEARAVIKFFFSARQDAEGNSRYSDRNIVGWTTFWFFFLSGLQKLEQRGKKCIELRGEYVV